MGKARKRVKKGKRKSSLAKSVKRAKRNLEVLNKLK